MKNTLIIFITALITISCGSAKESLEEVPVPVKVSEITKINDFKMVSAGGSVTSQNSPARLTFLVSGRILNLIPREGDFVKKGSLIAEIDPTDYKYALQSAEAQVGMAKAFYEKVASSVRPEELEQARVAYERSADEFMRMKMIYDAGSLAPNDYHKYKAAYEIEAYRYQMALDGGQKEDRERALSALKEAEAGLELARKHLKDTKLYAVSDGYISKRFLAPGDTTSAGTPVVEVVSLDPVDISVGIPEKDIRLVTDNLTAVVSLAALPDEVFKGRVRVVNVSADPATRTYLTKIEVENPDNILKIGMVSDVSVITNKPLEMLTVPLSILVKDPQGATGVFVFNKEDQRAYRVKVDTGMLYGKNIEITQGLKGNEIVIVAGQQRLRDGVSVKIVSE